MKKSKFQFASPVMLELEFLTNGGFSPGDEVVDIETQVSSRHIIDGENAATVQLLIEIGEKSENCPFFLRTVYQANFTWDKDSLDDKVVDRLLKQNAVLLLLSFARPAIATITNFSEYAPYNIPYIDLTDG
ncbi:MAG: protein-export chaperone SecB [Oscillospiraceae bacterium]|nr:protein-export chaperone SecB [Oscillospiraceae bacterium]